MQTAEDLIAQNNICLTSESELKEMFLDDLVAGQVEDGTVVWVTTIADAGSSGLSIALIVEDKKGSVISLALYNQLSVDAKL